VSNHDRCRSCTHYNAITARISVPSSLRSLSLDCSSALICYIVVWKASSATDHVSPWIRNIRSIWYVPLSSPPVKHLFSIRPSIICLISEPAPLDLVKNARCILLRTHMYVPSWPTTGEEDLTVRKPHDESRLFINPWPGLALWLHSLTHSFTLVSLT